MTKIQWTDATWNPLVGCSRVSAGCEHCYAERVAHRGMAESHRGLTVLGKKGPRWNGEVRFLPERLEEPLRWRKPRKVFVNSMSDLFHEGVSNEQIAAVFGVMAACPQHTFQVLTKRPERMLEWFRGLGDDLFDLTGRISVDMGAFYNAIHPDPDDDVWGERVTPYAAAIERVLREVDDWPLPNVWLGVSVEDQATADARIPLLLQAPAAVRWVSYEPALGPLDFGEYLEELTGDCGCFSCENGSMCEDGRRVWPAVDWIVVGGESGHGARPFDLVWLRSTIEQARATGVPVFVKQLGAVPRYRVDSEMGRELPRADLYLRDRKGGDMDEWPEDVRVRQWPATAEEARHA